MKRLIFLKEGDYNPEDKKMKADELEKAKAKVLAVSIKDFRDGIKENKFIKISQELPGLHQVIVEFPDDQYDSVHDTLRSIDVVEIIDANLPLDPIQKKKLEEATEEDYATTLKKKMAKFKK
jgi:hypothetical protein